MKTPHVETPHVGFTKTPHVGFMKTPHVETPHVGFMKTLHVETPHVGIVPREEDDTAGMCIHSPAHFHIVLGSLVFLALVALFSLSVLLYTSQSVLLQILGEQGY
jgi:hypothetical protein